MLGECLAHLLRQSLPPAEVLVMDNASADDSAEHAAQLAGVTVRKLGANLGFAAANNRAIFDCASEFVALLNPDAFAEPDWLERLVAAAWQYPEAAAFGSRQMLHGAPGILDGIGDVYHISGLPWRHGHGVAARAEDFVAGEIFCPCAAAALYRREALLAVGGFDEDFFCYVEDVDLGFRLRLAGHSARYVPDAVVHHVGSGLTGGRHSAFSVYHGHRNLVWAFVKDMPGPLFWALLPVHLLQNLVTLVYFALRGHGPLVFRAKRDALRGLPGMWRKRRTIQAGRRASVRDIWRVLDKRLSTARQRPNPKPQ